MLYANLEIVIEDDPNNTYAPSHKTRLKRAAIAAARLTLRRFVAGMMIIVALGRFDFYPSYVQSAALSRTQYGFMLLILGLLLWPGGYFKMSKAGRVIAGLSAILMAGMAWDAGTVGVTSVIEFWMALALLREIFVNDP